MEIQRDLSHRPRHTAEGLLSVDKITCPFSYFADRCNTVTNVNIRKRMLQCQSRCYICTIREGITHEIVKSITCFQCKGRHHTSICERDKNSSRQKTNSDKSNDSKKSDNTDSIGNNEQAQQPNTSRTVTNTVTSNKIVVLMQTATVVVNSKQNN